VLLLIACLFYLIDQPIVYAVDEKQMKTEKKKLNRLSKEKSPYLLQHADNPVDWYPWGEEAFKKAREEGKLIFLSIGYSTCHWCHVMEHESFENEEIAKIINDYYVPIKVDREERPDIDNIYMKVVMAMTGHGGWPLTVILTYDKKPIFGGTYFPPQAKWGQPGIVDILQSVHHSWKNDKEKFLASSESFTNSLIERSHVSSNANQLTKEVMDKSFNEFLGSFDRTYGGFGRAPKFPTSHNLSFLLRYWKRTGKKDALEMVEKTLTEMAEGGMYDQLGGGFHRYSTDQYWQIPHFEKMLYDQAIIVRTYLEVYQITKNPFYEKIAREIFDYVLRDMTDKNGGFYSAEDADSIDPDEYNASDENQRLHLEKKEGQFYLWKYDEAKEILSDKEFEIFSHYINIQTNGNAHSDPHGEFISKNILFVKNDVKSTAEKFGLSVEQMEKTISKMNAQLLKVRNDRSKPYRDDKVLVDWNGLMIGALAYGSSVLNEPRYRDAAIRAVSFINKTLLKDGRLLHRYRDGEAGIQATIEDYAFYVHGLLELYEATLDVEYLRESFRLMDDTIRMFWDDKEGGFYFTAVDAEKLLFRQKEAYDGAIPSGNSYAALNLIRLYHITLNANFESSAETIFNHFAGEIMRRPSAYSQMLSAFDYAVGPSQEIIFATEAKDKNLNEMLQTLHTYYLPNKVVVLREGNNKRTKELLNLAPFIKNQSPIERKTTAYVCENHQCQLPVTTPEKLKQILMKL